MRFTSQQQFIESVPGVVPENPLQYTLDLLRHNRIKCSEQMRYSPAATSWMMDSASEYHGLISEIKYFRKRCRDIQLEKTEPYSFEPGDFEKLRGAVAQNRANDMEHVLMKRDFAFERLNETLDESVRHDWKHTSVPFRAAILLELDGYLPTFEQVEEQCLMNPEEDKENKEHMAYAREKAQYYYPFILSHAIEKNLGPDYHDDSIYIENSYNRVYQERVTFYQEFRSMLDGKAIDILEKAKKTGKLEEGEAKILAFSISSGTTGDIHSVSEHDLSRSIYPGGYTLTRKQIYAWLPKEQPVAA